VLSYLIEHRKRHVDQLEFSGKPGPGSAERKCVQPGAQRGSNRAAQDQ
jgi:hypothetical protein